MAKTHPQQEAAPSPPTSQTPDDSVRGDSLRVLLAKFEQAMEVREQALGQDDEIRALAASLQAKEANLRIRAGDPPDPATLTCLTSATSEQVRIEEIRGQRREAESQMDELWPKIVAQLDSSRSSRTRELFRALDAMAFPPFTEARRRMNLVEEILRAAGSRRTTKRVTSEAAVEARRNLVLEIKTLNREGLSHEEICQRLDGLNRPRPARTKWRHLSYLEAFQSEEHHDAVKTWISKAIHR